MSTAQDSLPERRLESDEIGGIVDRFETLNTGCRYELEAERSLLSVEHPICASADWQIVEEALQGIRSGTSALGPDIRAEVRRAFDQLRAEGRVPGPNTTDSYVVVQPEGRLEIIDVHVRGYAAKLRTSGFSLGYRVDYVDDIHMLEATTLQEGVQILRDPRELYSPVLLSPFSLSWLRRYIWLETTQPGDETRTFKVYFPNEPWTYFRFELDVETLLPLSASSHDDRTSDECGVLAVFEYAPIEEGSSQVWLKSSLQITNDPRNLFLIISTLDDVNFDVRPGHVVFEVDPSTVLADDRTPDYDYFHSGEHEKWPQDLIQFVEFIEDPKRGHPPEGAQSLFIPMEDEESESEESSERPAPEPTPWMAFLGGCMMLFGSGYLVSQGSKRGLAS